MANSAKDRALAEKADRDAQEANTRGFNEAAPRSMGTFKGEAPEKAASTFGGLAQRAVNAFLGRKEQLDAAIDKAEGKKPEGKKHGGKINAYAKGGFVKSADGCAQRGKTKGRFV
jgi:hypothetical protein